MLGRLHVVSDPLSSGPRSVAIEDDTIVTAPVVASKWDRAKLMKYDLVVIDEAHHLFRDEASKQLVEPFVHASERCMLLSDISQSLREDIKYPDIGLHVVTLTEVVRSSKRIVAASLQFQLTGAASGGQAQGLSRCAHKSEGPPLKSFLFDIGAESDRYDAYAEHTVRAVRSRRRFRRSTPDDRRPSSVDRFRREPASGLGAETGIGVREPAVHASDGGRSRCGMVRTTA